MRRDGAAAAPILQWPAARERCLREARRYARSSPDAEDIVQEALLRAWKKRTKLRNTAEPMPWLLQITRNEALRSLSNRARDASRAVLVEEEPDRPLPDEWTERMVSRIDVQAALGHLEDDERVLVSLRYAEDLTHSHIADLMGIPVGTCKVRLHRLRKRLAVLLAEED